MGRKSNNEKLSIILREKSIDALLLCIETYNKPTINFRIEASSFLLCNAWELLLKSNFILKEGEKSIIRKSDSKTYSLEEMVKRIYDNPNNPIRQNLIYIIENIRDKATHYIIKEHDIIYTPLLQKAILNYVDELKRLFNQDLTETIPLESIALIVKKYKIPPNLNKLYGKSLANSYLQDEESLNTFITNSYNKNGSEVVAVVESKLSFVKNPKDADIKAFYDNNGKPLEKIIVSKDVNISHPYTMKQIIKKIKEYFPNDIFEKLHNNSLNIFNKENSIYNKPEYYTTIFYGNSIIKKYSELYFNLLINIINQNPDLFKKRKK